MLELTHEQLEQLLERCVPLLEHMATAYGDDLGEEASKILEEIGWG